MYSKQSFQLKRFGYCFLDVLLLQYLLVCACSGSHCLGRMTSILTGSNYIPKLYYIFILLRIILFQLLSKYQLIFIRTRVICK